MTCHAAVDVLLDFTVQFSGGGSPAYLEIDKLPDGRYRDLAEKLNKEAEAAKF